MFPSKQDLYVNTEDLHITFERKLRSIDYEHQEKLAKIDRQLRWMRWIIISCVVLFVVIILASVLLKLWQSRA